MYEETSSAAVEALLNTPVSVFNPDLIDKILALTTAHGSDATIRFEDAVPDASGNVTVAAGAEVVFIKTSDIIQTTIVAPKNAPVVIFQGLGGVSATLDDGATTVSSAAGIVDRVVVGSAAADRIVIADKKNSQVTIGDGDTVVAGGGNDTIVAGGGASTVEGGTGHAIVKMTGNASAYTVTVNNGHAVVTNASLGSVTDISKIQFVQLDSGKALVFAKDSNEAAVTTLYETAFGRTADANGLKYWFDAANAGVSLHDIAVAFTTSEEFSTIASMTDSAFVNSLYMQTFGRAGEQAGVDYWTGALTAGATRADMIEAFSNIAAQHFDGTLTGEAGIVGSVTIVHNII